MKKLKLIIVLTFSISMLLIAVPHTALAGGIPCDPNDSKYNNGEFLGLPHWYKYLKGEEDTSGRCIPQFRCTDTSEGACSNDSQLQPNKIYLVGLAVLEILLRIAGFVTVAMVIFGGFKYITSQGQPDATKNARGTIINAFIGLVITLLATVSVNFIARLLQ